MTHYLDDSFDWEDVSDDAILQELQQRGVYPEGFFSDMCAVIECIAARDVEKASELSKYIVARDNNMVAAAWHRGKQKVICK